MGSMKLSIEGLVVKVSQASKNRTLAVAFKERIPQCQVTTEYSFFSFSTPPVLLSLPVTFPLALPHQALLSKAEQFGTKSRAMMKVR